MMERASWPFGLSVTLSYDEESQEHRDAARMFNYSHVRLWLARLRDAARGVNPAARLRFLVCGEQGPENGRCHWHCVLFSDVPLWSLGVVTGFKSGTRRRQVLTEWNDVCSPVGRPRRHHWDMWGRGFVTFQDADQDAMHYVLSYVLMDQFTPEKAKGSRREHLAGFATGLFRMSKRPAIGERFMYDKFARLAAGGSVLPALQWSVPGLKGHYTPAGSFRQKALWAMVASNHLAFWATGRNAPQWSSLFNSCSELEPDLEILKHGEAEKTDETSDQSRLDLKLREGRHEYVKREFAAVCGRSLPCGPCLTGLSDDALAALDLRRVVGETVDILDPEGRSVFRRGQAAIETRGHALGEFVGRSNPFCQRRGSKISRETFPGSDRTDLRHLQAAP